MELYDVQRTEDKEKNAPLVVEDNYYALVQALKELSSEIRKMRAGVNG